MPENMLQERDVMVVMRDGVRIAADIYRPGAPGRFPVLYTCAMHNKDLQRVEIVENLKVGQPAWSTMWYGILEAGDSKRFVANGYVHVIGQVRGGHKSEGMPDQGDEWDEYDVFEWICAQPWCDGNIGMVGLSGFAGRAMEGGRAAASGAQGHLPSRRNWRLYGGPVGFREAHPGWGHRHHVLSLGPEQQHAHGTIGTPPELPPPVEEAWQKAMQNQSGLHDARANLYTTC
jgi:hypothetical protein